jgi:type II secretory pathway predicted ATPase ExeA
MLIGSGEPSMIESHFGLTRRPFFLHPEDAPYAATSFEHCLAATLEALEAGDSMVVLTGVPGVGKSLLARVLSQRLDAQIAYVTTAVNDRAGLLQAILYDLGLPHEGRPERELRLTLVDHLLAEFASGRRTVFLIDEAHTLRLELLEELRTLMNLEGALQIVLLGQPSLVETLARPELAGLRQRIVHCHTLEPMSVEESADYVLHYLRQAGANPDLMGTETLELLATHCGGLPRRLNQAMTRALRLTAQAQTQEIEVEIMLDVLSSLGLSVSEPANSAANEPAYRLFAPAHRA